MDMDPVLEQQIQSDRSAGRFGSWATSTVLDENIGHAVIPRELFEHLHDQAGIAAEWPIGNAGLLHVYGYLLSTVDTPYGLKRDRWLDGKLARILLGDADAFLPHTGKGSLLSRITEAVLPLLTEVPPKALLAFDQAAIDSPCTFRTVVIGTAVIRTAVIGTAAIGTANGCTVNGEGAVIYGVEREGTMRVITAFPLESVTSASLARMRIDAGRGSSRMRYNAAVEGLAPRSPLQPAVHIVGVGD